jgi:hypothetical protein
MLPLLAGTVKRAIVPATTPTPKPARRDGYLMKARTAQVESIVTGSMGVPRGPVIPAVNGTVMARKARTDGIRWRVRVDLAGERC